MHYTCWMAMGDNSYLHTIHVGWPWMITHIYTPYMWMAMSDNSYLYTIYVGWPWIITHIYTLYMFGGHGWHSLYTLYMLDGHE